MKKPLLLLYLLFASLLVFSQQSISKSAIASSAGGQVETNTVNISKWSLNEIPLVILSQSNTSELTELGWRASAFPNPFAESLNLQIETANEKTFLIELSDLSGKKIWISSNKTIANSQILKLDINDLPPATYFLSVVSQTDKATQVIKVQKGE